MLAKAVELAQAHGWFLTPAVRERSQSRHSFAHDGGRDPRRLQRCAARLLGDRNGHRRNAEGRRARAARAQRRTRRSSPASPTILRSSAAAFARHAAADGTPSESHPFFRPHLMQGWTPDFIPKLAEDAVDAGLIDEIVPVKGADALRLSRELAQKEGIFAGISSGATLAAALDVAARAPKGANILCMLPDTGERYLSTPLFEDISVGHDGGRNRHRAIDAALSFRRQIPAAACAGRDRAAACADSKGRSLRREGDQRPGTARGDVCARMVRVLLVGAQTVSRVRYSLSRRSIWIRPNTRKRTGAVSCAMC